MLDIDPKLKGTVIQFGLETRFRILLPEAEFDQLFQLLMTDFTLPCALSTITGKSIRRRLGNHVTIS